MLRNATKDVPIAFVWNMDGIDHSDWADAHPENVYVPIDFSADQVPVLVSRDRQTDHSRRMYFH
jgi:hypothetical protein